MSTNRKTPETKPRTKYNQNMVNRGVSIPAGIYLGEVTANNDPDYPGARVKVHIFSILPAILPAEENPGTEQALGSIWCQRMTPFAANSGDYSYGMMGPPPEIGNTVVVAYSGDYASGIILGVLPDLQKREGLQTGGSPRGKTNDGVVAASEPDRAGNRKPDPIASADKAKAALKTDDLRNPSQVFNHKNISMNDDGGNHVTVSPGTDEDKAGAGVRMGTGRGAQIMMDNKTDTIFMNNASGDYISMDTNGNIDLYCSGMFSIHAVGGINFHTGNTFNVQSDSGINMKSNSPIKMQSAGGGIDLSAQSGIKLTATGGKLEVSSSGDIVLKSGGNVHLNGPAASPAETPAVAAQPGNSAVSESASGRVPGPLPWSGLSPYNQGAVQGRGGSGGGGGGGYSGGGGGGGGYSTAPGANVDPNRVGNFYPSIPPDASLYIEWADGVDRRISRKLFDAVAKVASSAGIRFKITEGLVLPANAGGLNAADTSLHAKGEAVDVVLIGGGSSVMTKTMVDKIIRLAKENGIGGIGAYNGKVQSAGFVDEFHFDLGRPRMWGQCTDNSLSYECLPTFVKQIAEKYDYEPDIPAEDSRFATGNGAVDLKDISGNSNAEKLYNYFVNERGYTPEQAAGAVGSMMGESYERLDPTAINSIGATGIAQWLGSRKDNLYKFAANPNAFDPNSFDSTTPLDPLSFDTQLQFLDWELNNDTLESRTDSYMRKTTNTASATKMWTKIFERPSTAELNSSLAKRQTFANNVLNSFK